MKQAKVNKNILQIKFNTSKYLNSKNNGYKNEKIKGLDPLYWITKKINKAIGG